MAESAGEAGQPSNDTPAAFASPRYDGHMQQLAWIESYARQSSQLYCTQVICRQYVLTCNSVYRPWTKHNMARLA